jgi:hypothetical protein
MKKQFKKLKAQQGGWAMIETLSAITIGAVIGAGIMGLVNQATAGNQSQDVGTKIADVATKIQKNYKLRGSYDTLTPAAVKGMGLATAPLTWVTATSKIQDPWGNVVNVSGNTAGASATFGITVGGTTSPLDKATCTDIATQLVSGADVINVGAAATVANGLVSGGTAYKAAATAPDPAVLATACDGATPVIAIQYH